VSLNAQPEIVRKFAAKISSNVAGHFYMSMLHDKMHGKSEVATISAGQWSASGIKLGVCARSNLRSSTDCGEL